MVALSKTAKDFIGLSVVYFVTRFTFLTRYPVFNDEATYLRYAQVMIFHPLHRWYSLAHTGKQPLLYWFYGLMMYVVNDPLLAGRLVTVLLGILTVIAVYQLGTLLDSRKTGIIAAIFIIFSPLFVFFDRLALVDSTLASLFSWILVCLVRFEKRQTIMESIVIGLLVGVSLWIKSTGFLFALLACGGIVFIWVRHKRRFSLMKYLSILSAAIAVLVFPLFIRPESKRIFEMSHDYTYTISEVVARRFAHVPENLINTILVYGTYISPIVFIASLLYLRKSFRAGKGLVGIFWILSLCVILVFGKGVHGRYLVFTAVPLVVLAAMQLRYLSVVRYIAIVSMGLLSLVVIINPPAFFHLFPVWNVWGVESWQYIDGWPSGYGIREAFDAIDRDRNGVPAVLAVRWDMGNPEDAAFVYTRGNPYLATHYLDLRLPKEARQILYNAPLTKTYFLTRKGQYDGFEKLLEPMAVFPKPRGSEQLELFRVKRL